MTSSNGTPTRRDTRSTSSALMAYLIGIPSSIFFQLNHLTEIRVGIMVTGMAKVTLDGYRCERCDHEWVPRDKEQEPTVCPKCKSPYWNKPRKSGEGVISEQLKRGKSKGKRED